MIDAGNDLCRVFIDRSYDDFAVMLKELIAKERYDKFVTVTDENVYKLCYEVLESSFEKEGVNSEIEPIIIKAGESNKNLKQYGYIIDELRERNIGRKSLIIAFGGGVCGDIAGFAAATYMRGIDYIQLPTTLLSQVDSSIGGKTGIDTKMHKNTIGAFKQPLFTYINTEILKTLPEIEIKCGIGEIIKYACIMDDDGEFMKYISENTDKIKSCTSDEILQVVWRCSGFKAKIVKADEYETCLRKILNFGHTFGHAIELLADISHGEAVVEGIKMAFKYAVQKGYVKESYLDMVSYLIERFDMNTHINTNEYEKIVELMKRDKKNSFGKITLILPTVEYTVGQFDVNENDINIIKEIIKSNS